MTKRLAIFNHKGGVSKTTTVYNLGWMLAKTHKVLVVDADPQCNLTSLLLGDSFEKYYVDGETAGHNIKDGVSPAFMGKPVPISAVNCFSPQRAPALFLLAGHANLSEFDAALTFAQTSNNAISALQNLPGAFSELLRLTEEKYGVDFTLIDLNPSLSAINQNLFLSSAAFLIPTNPDPFSIMAIGTLQQLLPRWCVWKQSAMQLFAGSAYPFPAGTPKFVGTVIQRFNIRNGKAAKPYRDNIEEIKVKLGEDLVTALSSVGMTLPAAAYGAELIKERYCLSEIPDFQGLLPKAHAIGVPVFELSDVEIAESGPVLEQMQHKRALFNTLFIKLSKDISALLAHA